MSGAGKANRVNATLPWLTGPVVRTIGTARSGLHWAFGETGPAHSATN